MFSLVGAPSRLAQSQPRVNAVVQGGAAKAPAPVAKDVYVHETPAMQVYVYSFGGIATQKDHVQAATAVISKLKANKLPYVSGYFYTAGYDSPVTLENRHNEVWIPVK